MKKEVNTLKCRFCGKRIKKNNNICSKCGKEVTEGLGTDELIDSLPELHDEFDNISKMQAKEERKKQRQQKRAEHKTRRIVICIVVILAILGGVATGMLYFRKKEAEEKEAEAKKITTSAVESLINKSFVTGGFDGLYATNAGEAKSVLTAFEDAFSFVDVANEFELDKEIKINNTTIYRFSQKYKGIPVYNGEMIIMANSQGEVIALNGIYVPTNGLTTSYGVDMGSASASITEYVNSLEDFAVVEGINITDIKKAVCNTNGKAYLTYTANVSGYNASAEYIAYDVFIDGITGKGVCVSVTSSFENDSLVTKDDIDESYIFSMSTASDKFNWNDESVSTATEPINIDDIKAGNASAYVSSVKNTVDYAYNYFNNNFGWKGLSGDGKSFEVYINANEYVEEDLPTEMAMYTNEKLMFFREDLTQGDIDYNTVVHEYAHGVMHNLVGFSGTMGFSENSSIAEGLADIFAELAESSMTGVAPDWIHKERTLYAPTEEYYISIPDIITISDVSECYHYSTIVSHFAFDIAQIVPDLNAQNEFWFKAMCLMTKNTDFSELSSIFNTVALNMYNEYKLTDTQYAEIISAVSGLYNSNQSTEIIQ